jgi:ribonuclease HI
MEGKTEMVRIQFEMTRAEYDENVKQWVRNEKLRHEFAHDALLELCNRKLGYDKKARRDKIVTDSKYVQEMIDEGLLKWPGK